MEIFLDNGIIFNVKIKRKGMVNPTGIWNLILEFISAFKCQNMGFGICIWDLYVYVTLYKVCGSNYEGPLYPP